MIRRFILIVFFIPLVMFLASCKNNLSSSSFSSGLSMVSAPNTTNRNALRIYQVLPGYAEATKLSWEPIQLRVPLKVGQADNRLPAIRERLIALNYLPKSDTSKSIIFNPQFAHAIAEFQSHNGLMSTGVINQETLDALNITPATRYHELVKSMDEWAKYPQDPTSRYILVNIPNYTLYLIDQGSDVLQMKVVVGKPARPTPTLKSDIKTIVFNPTWTVPKTILAEDIIPGMRENPNYMKEHYDMRVYASYDKNAPEVNPSTIDWQTATLENFKYRVTAPPSDKNPLGRVKFIFENDQDVYMHDTPAKDIFSLKNRAHSSGCIRLEDPMALVRYFYADNSDLNQALVDQYLASNETKFIQLKNAMPVYITYITAWVDNEGHAHFEKDVYR